MKNIILTLLTTITIGLTTGCSGPESPSFQKLDNLKIVPSNNDNIVLTGNAVFYNPNNIGGMLTNTRVKILVNDIMVSEINQTNAIEIPKKQDFEVPLRIEFDLQKILKENDGFLKNALTLLLNNDLEVRYVGTVTIKILKIKFEVPIDYSEKVSFGFN